MGALADKAELQVVDVREASEQSELAAGALAVPYRLLAEADLSALDPERPTAVVCQTGTRSPLAASLLARRGLHARPAGARRRHGQLEHARGRCRRRRRGGRGQGPRAGQGLGGRGMAEPEHEQLSWQELGDGTRALAEMVHASGYAPDVILAIARGGLLVAGAMGYALGAKNVFTVNVEFYTGEDERLELPILLPPVPDPERARAAQGADLRRRRRHGRHAGARPALLRAPRGRGAHRRALREASLDRALRLRLAPHRRWITFAWSALPPVGADAATHAG